MDCERFAVIVHELARPERAQDDPLGSYLRQAALGHARGCRVCGARLADARVLAKVLGATAQEFEHAQAPARLETLLVEAFRGHHRGVQEENSRLRRMPRRSMEWVLLGTAAAVLLAVGVWNFFPSHGLHPGANLAPTATIAENRVGASGTAAAGRGEEASATQPDPDSGFVPVPYGEGLDAVNSGVVVRVEIPRSALAELGYPVDELNSGDLVQADVVVGEDGWPHAVRLVNQNRSSGGSR